MPFIPSNINEMLQNIYQDNLTYANKFEVIITPPKFQLLNQQDMKKMTLRCESVAVPGRSITTQNYRFYGPQRQMPFEILYSGDITLSFILSNDLKERNFFEGWINGICNKDNYKFSYYDDYATSIEIHIMNRSDDIVYTAILEEAYPKSMGELGLAYEKENEFLRQEITFAYRKWSPVITAGAQASLGNNTPNQINNSAPTMITNSRDRVQQQFQRINGRLVRVGSDGSVNGVIGGTP